jgi:hypothetical protein
MMQGAADYTQSYQKQSNPLILPLKAAIGITILISLILILLTIFGYGSLHLSNIPDTAIVRINGHATTESTFKLRPGDYQILVASPIINPQQVTVNVGLFRTTTFTPKLEQRSAASIFSSLIGGVNAAGPPKPGRVQWFHDNTWVVGQVVPGNAELAAYYDAGQKQWILAFYNGGGYPTDLTKLPADVAAYITTLETNYGGG